MQVSVVDELGIPIKFVGVGEGVEELQPFDAEAFVNAIFSWGLKSGSVHDETRYDHMGACCLFGADPFVKK